MCSEDADLILFCLYHNPMNKSPFFKRRLMLLKEILQQKFESHTSYNIDKFFFYEATYNGFSEKHEEKIIKFAFALFSQNYVSVSEKGNFSTKQMLIPIGIRFTENGATFVLYSEETQFDLRIDVEDIEESHHRINSSHGYHPDKEDYRTVFMLKANGIKKNFEIRSMSLTDIAPTISETMGFGKMECDGKAVKEIFIQK